MVAAWTGVLLSALAASSQPADAAGKPNALSSREIAEGWILLFDGETSFGWKIGGASKVADGVLALGDPESKEPLSAQTTTQFVLFELQLDYRLDTGGGVQVVLDKEGYDLVPADETGAANATTWVHAHWKVEPKDKGCAMAASYSYAADGKAIGGFEPCMKPAVASTPIMFQLMPLSKVSVRNIKLKPLGTKPIFNGKDLSGWKAIPGKKSKFTVTDKGEINVKDGNGELQTEAQWDDFVLQLDVISNGDHLNSGIFFRCLPGQFWQGYEMQVRNQWEGENRAKPVDCGTGGLYNRQPTRRVVPSDREWFTATIVAQGKHIATWVNGYQCTDYVDDKPAAPTARKGSFLGKGCVSIQGHDPTTDLSFRSIRLAEIPKGDKQKP
jgi:hypothetical protein